MRPAVRSKKQRRRELATCPALVESHQSVTTLTVRPLRIFSLLAGGVGNKEADCAPHGWPWRISFNYSKTYPKQTTTDQSAWQNRTSNHLKHAIDLLAWFRFHSFTSLHRGAGGSEPRSTSAWTWVAPGLTAWSDTRRDVSVNSSSFSWPHSLHPKAPDSHVRLEYPFLLLMDTTEAGSGSHEALEDSGVSSQGLLMFQLIPPLMRYSPNTALF